MKPGDLVFDHDLGQHGLITEVKVYRCYPDTKAETLGYEYVVLYQDGDFDTAYENSLEVIK